VLSVKNSVYSDMTLSLLDICVVEDPAPTSSGLKCKMWGKVVRMVRG
jgi:hypothetical protein